MTVPVPVELSCTVCYGLPAAEQPTDTNAVTIYEGKTLCRQHAGDRRLTNPDGTLVECSVCLGLPTGDRSADTLAHVVDNGNAYCTVHADEILAVMTTGGVFGR